ncbi:MAG: YqaA family protein [bacterium]|nr:DedA family protein [Bacillota bacterium]
MSWLDAANEFLLDHGLIGLIITAFAEASFFPLPPDVILIPLSLLRPQLGFLYAAVATVASSLGGVFGALLGFYLGRPVLEYFSSQKRIDQVAGLFHRYGGWAVALAALTPIPYKVFTIAAGVFRVRLWVVLTASLAGRGLRFFLEALAVFLWGDEATSFISNYLGPATFGLAVLLILAALLRSRYHRRTR